MNRKRVGARALVSTAALMGALILAVFQTAIIPDSVRAGEEFEFAVENVGFTDIAGLGKGPELVQPGVAGDGRVAGGTVFGNAFQASRTNAALTQRQNLAQGSNLFVASTAFDINNSGSVVGLGRPASGDPRAFRFTTQNGLQALPFADGGSQATAFGVNDAGVIVGFSNRVFDLRVEGGEDGAVEGALIEQATRWTGNQIEVLGALRTGGTSRAHGISTEGFITGQSQVPSEVGVRVEGGFEFHAFRIPPGGGNGEMEDLGTLTGGSFSRGQAVNDAGDVAGGSDARGGLDFRAFRFRNGTMQDLGVLQPGGSSDAFGINSAGNVVGAASVTDGKVTRDRAFLFTDADGMRNLNDLIDPAAGWFLERATDINDAGQIVGFGELNGVPRVFRLTPLGVPDTDPPAITSCALAPLSLPAAGGTVTIDATVTDNIGVDSVTVSFAGPGGPFTGTLTRTSGNNFRGTVTLPANPTATARSFVGTLTARDAAGNTDTDVCDSVTVAAADVADPVITACSIAPTTLPAAGGTVTINATVTDNVGVRSVLIIFRGPGGPFKTNLARKSGNNFRGTLALPGNTGSTAQTFTSELSAEDTSGNETSEACDSVTVSAPDTGRPDVIDCTLAPKNLPSKGGNVTVTVDATDDGGGGVSGTGGGLIVTVIVTAPGGAERRQTLPRLNGDRFRGTVALPANTTAKAQVHSFAAIAEDNSGNVSDVHVCGTVTVAGVQGRLRVTPKVLSFGATKKGQTKRKIVTLTNVGDGILSGEIEPPDPPFAVIPEGQTKPPTQPVPYTLNPGESIRVTVLFTPRRNGTFGGRLPITSSDPGSPAVRVRIAGTAGAPKKGKKDCDCDPI